MTKKIIKYIRSQFNKLDIDGYVVPKNDEFFSEYSKKDRLKIVSNFSGSAGYAVILKNKNYLFVDGRYNIQAQLESGDKFKIVSHQKIINCKLFKNLKLGINPKLFTSNQIKKFFLRYNRVKYINFDLIEKKSNKQSENIKQFYSLEEKIVGENYKSKISKVRNFLKKNKSNFLFISAPDNVAWLLNIRGYDNPNSPVPNCNLLLDDKKNIYLVANKNKAKKILKDGKIKSNFIIEPKKFDKFIDTLKGKNIIIDTLTCSIFNETILSKKFRILKKKDPIYLLKAIKNKTEIKNMINAHIHDGVALTKFLYWIKEVNKKKITEFEAQEKLESFRKKNSNYLYPSFNTIMGSGKNAAIVHYRATKDNTKIIEDKDILLCDSGGQYRYGTTDVTRTICFNKPNKSIKNIFTKVLKGHIAVVSSDLSKYNTGNSIDKRARKFLKKVNLDYSHGTGHGVGFFLNVHEGPQSISKFNNIKFSEGMIVSNEPGYYKKGQFGFRIENLIYVKKIKNKLFFENLTLAPIDKDLIDFKQLSKSEKNYLFKYNINVCDKLFKFLNKNEKKWLASFI